MSLVVESAGLLTVVEDRGRPSLGHLGVSPSGAFDRGALRQVNALLGNEPTAAALEVLGGGLVLRAAGPHLVAVTGGVGTLTVDGESITHGRVVPVRAGQVLKVGDITTGLRAYVGVAGGIDARHELDSRSTDTLSGLGPAPLAAGDRLEVGTLRGSVDVEDVPALISTGLVTVGVLLGPRDDWFAPAAVRTLLESAWQVSPDSDRIGVRLGGPALERIRTEELPSEPCVRGSVQVSADGQPIVFGPDHPVTGGYPVIAVVIDRDTDRLAQLRPGETVRFQPLPAAPA